MRARAALLAAGLALVAPAVGTTATAPEVTLTVKTVGNGVVTSSPPGIACPPTCSASFPAGSSVTLTVEARSGAAFGGWSGACSGTSGACLLALTRAARAGATFSGARPASSSGIALGGRTWRGRRGVPLRGFLATFAGLPPTAAPGYKAEVTWGDGKRSSGEVVWVRAQTYAVLAEHAYARKGTYGIVVRIRRGDSPGRVVRASAVVA